MNTRGKALLGLGFLAGLFMSGTAWGRTPVTVPAWANGEREVPTLCEPSDAGPMRSINVIRLRGGCRARLRITLELPEWLGLKSGKAWQ